MKYTDKRYCKNCFYPLPYQAKFCAHCGQRDTDGKVSMRDFFLRVWNTTFHLESKFLRMVWQLLIPGKVTIEYFKGKQKRYPHPLQFFLIVMFFVLFYVSKQIGKTENEQISMFGWTNNFEETKGKLTLIEHIKNNIDSLPSNLRAPQQRQAIDSLIGFTEIKEQLTRVYHDSLTVFSPIPPFHQTVIAEEDALNCTIDSISRKYKIESWAERLVLQQRIKTGKDQKSLLRFYVGSSTWTILVLIGIMAGFLGFQFRKQKRLYVEHFVLLLHTMSGFLFLLMVLTLLKKGFYLPVKTNWSFWWLWLGLLWAIKRYYGLSWWISIRKWLVFSFVYLVCFVLVFAGSMGVGLLLF
jgi:hypothetical protein